MIAVNMNNFKRKVLTPEQKKRKCEDEIKQLVSEYEKETCSEVRDIELKRISNNVFSINLIAR